jgi:hypothetical protein
MRPRQRRRGDFRAEVQRVKETVLCSCRTVPIVAVCRGLDAENIFFNLQSDKMKKDTTREKACCIFFCSKIGYTEMLRGIKNRFINRRPKIQALMIQEKMKNGNKTGKGTGWQWNNHLFMRRGGKCCSFTCLRSWIIITAEI